MEDKRCHLQMIQAVITRMATNSFWLKGWSITLISALFALAANKINTSAVFVAYLPWGVFWLLDGYFLWQERLYRALYDQVRVLDLELIDYSMNTTSVVLYTPSFRNACFSPATLVFHGGLGIIVFAMSYLY